MAKYAKATSVPIERSKIEIERTLIRYGIEEFFYGSSPRGSGIAFKFNGRAYKMNVPTPDRNGYKTDNQFKQAQRQRWRILLLGIKAKLELVEIGLVSFEDEFLAQTCLPDGTTIGQYVQKEVIKSIETGVMPQKLLPS